MKPHYFDQDKPDEDDFLLELCIGQGYVPEGCLLNGQLVLTLTNEQRDPCKGCVCPREKCNGRKE